ncbi:MAG: hypothetical protein ACM3U2_06275 [Deltaproteobacteria bacterium]
MTGYTVHTGSTEKFAAGWDEIFRKGAKKPAPKAKKPGARKTPAAAPRVKSRKRPKAK